MAFPTTTAPLAGDLNTAISVASATKELVDAATTRMSAGSVTATQVLRLLDNLRQAQTTFNAIAARPGIGAYAQDQLGIDISGDFSAMLNAIDAAADNIVASIPKDGDGYLLIQQMDAQGTRTDRAFTSAQTTTLRGLLANVSATIE